MKHVNMHEAKTQLSKLVEAIESGRETEITIARNGHPAAMLVPVKPIRHVIVLGVADGHYRIPDDIDGDNEAVTAMFEGRAECD